MKRKFSLIKKIKAIAALSLVFLLVLATNMMDNQHFAVVKRTLTTIYEDRLVAKDYIYKMSTQLKEKQMALLTDTPEQIQRINTTANDSIRSLVALYAATKLTPSEAQHFDALQKNLSELYEAERQWADDDFTPATKQQTDKYYDELKNNLAALSEIQLQEGKRQIGLSTRAIASSDLISRLEIGTLIIIGIVIQILILYKPSE